jgi:Holliday junction resolvasome RuvABC DNA-binding subunit
MNQNDNRIIAERLREAAALLEQQNANPYRIAAYRRAANALESFRESVSFIFRTDGFEGLMTLTGIGPQIAGATAEMIRTGRWTQLERLRGSVDPEALFASVPGIGLKLARGIMEALHIDTLEALEIAAHDGRLATVPGFGARRIAMIRGELAQMLGRGRSSLSESVEEPGVDVLLDVDREYREKAAAGTLRRIAPKRFNPGNKAWLPILHTTRGAWQFSVLFSNTGLAHSLDRTNDWVVIYFTDDHHSEGQRTVVTETRGPLKGRRVVRGRERDCEAHYHLPIQLSLGVA